MGTEKSDAITSAADKYRSFLNDEANIVEWRHGGPPIYDAVNKLFEEGRTKEWPKGSLEEVVQNAIKSWEMELSHKTRIQDFKTINPDKFKLIVNGREGLSGEETLKLGSVVEELIAGGVQVLQGRRRKLRIVARRFPGGASARIRVGGGGCLFRAAGDRLQVQALGLL